MLILVILKQEKRDMGEVGFKDALDRVSDVDVARVGLRGFLSL